MTQLQLKAIYGTANTLLIKKMYKQQDHLDFMNKYGVLLKELRIGSLGKFKSILTVIVIIMYKFCFGLNVFMLYKTPII